MSVATKPAPVAGESILSVRNISKSFGAIKAVQNVSFD
ncbi:MAG: ABC-type branched-subunit amino acid transport system ATPase component, partial [Akkermansiaceae bacterium]